MNYANIKFNDIADGEGVRVSLFVSGCRNHCKGCFQPETWDFDYGEEFTYETFNEIMKELEKPQYQGLTILGGDPLELENISTVTAICETVKEFMPDKDIWLYTGYVIEDRYKEMMNKVRHNWKFESVKYGGKATNKYLDYCHCMNKLAEVVDVIVDGQFIQELNNASLVFKGSTNQRIIDMNKTRKQKKIVLWEK